MVGGPRRALDSLPPALLVYVGLAVSLLGVLPVLATVGVLGDGPEGPAGVVAALVFGVVFGGAGGFVVHLGLTSAMQRRLGRTRPFVPCLLALLVRRIDRRTLLAAAPEALLALMMLAGLASSSLRSRLGLEHVVVLEFFAIHSTAFLGLLAFVRWRGMWFALQILLFVALAGLYTFASQQAAGISGAVWFGALTLAKYGSYLAAPPSLARKGALALRWFTGLVIFMVLAGAFDVDLEAPADLAFATTYFLTLALFEVLDLLAPVGREER